MSLAIFDLDNTLISGDSDYEWGCFLVARGIVDGGDFEQKNKKFYDEYKAGRLDIFEFLKFALQPLAANDMASLNQWHKEYMAAHIQKMISPGALELVDKHRRRGDTLLIITATNRFVTAPIANEFGVENLLATDPEIVDDQFTGKVAGTPCFQEGKVTRLNQWLEETGENLSGSWFYTDSHNDLPLLRKVDNPVAVNPDDELRTEAGKKNWQIIEKL